MVQRWLRASGFAVTYARNITDVDDKIIERAKENGESISSLTTRLTAAMHEDGDRIGWQRPDIEPKATEHITEMLDLIARLENKGVAYRAPNGDVYYSVRQFEGYGKLSGKSLDDLRAGERVNVDTNKKDPFDFVLWKAAKPDEPHWDSIFGKGRPGWHIECSAMGCKHFGEHFDIHGGGWDLQFPHHENEIAQTEAATGKPWVNYWMHAAFLNMDNEKMSKSLGNFFTTREILKKLDPIRGGEEVRYFLLRGHYRSEINYTWDTLLDAGSTLLGFYRALAETPPIAGYQLDWSQPFAARFKEAMEDDFNTPIAFAILHELKNEINKTKSAELSAVLKALGSTLGFFHADATAFVRGGTKGAVDVDIDALIIERNEARQSKNFARSDEIRKIFDEMGIILEDGAGATTWRKK